MFFESVRILNNSVRKKEAPMAEINELKRLAFIFLRRRYATNSKTTAEAPLASPAITIMREKTRTKDDITSGSASVEIPRASVTA
jgi:hypothetical protein